MMHILLFGSFLLFPMMANASSVTISDIFTQAATKYDVPLDVLRAVCTHESQTHSNGVRQPWPWVLNVSGKGIWYKDRISALRGLLVTKHQGVENVDIGICQVNWYWHKQEFESRAQLLDPHTNIHYAAKYLSSLKREGDETWQNPVGRYHSFDPLRASEYSARVLQP